MKVLFVCKANVGRSQVAQVRFEQLSKHESYCAGIGVAESVAQRPSSKLKDIRNLRPVEYIKTRLGVDHSERDRLQLTPEMIDDPDISKRLESAFSYVGGPTETLFSGVYVREKLPGIIALTIMGGM